MADEGKMEVEEGAQDVAVAAKDKKRFEVCFCFLNYLSHFAVRYFAWRINVVF